MHPVLASVIASFRAAQDLAVTTLLQHGVAQPESNVAWACSCYSLGLRELGQRIGISIRPHGYGVELQFPTISIDFDWGERGEGYGFDVWRLWNHCANNRLFLDMVTHDLIKLRFERAAAAGEIVADRLLHYLPEERAKFGFPLAKR